MRGIARTDHPLRTLVRLVGTLWGADSDADTLSFMLCVLHNSTPFMFIGLFLLVWLDSTRGKYFEDMSTTTAFVLMFGIGLIVFGIISGLFCLW